MDYLLNFIDKILADETECVLNLIINGLPSKPKVIIEHEQMIDY